MGGPRDDTPSIANWQLFSPWQNLALEPQISPFFFFLVAKTVALVAAVQMLQRPIKQGPPTPPQSFGHLGLCFQTSCPV